MKFVLHATTHDIAVHAQIPQLVGINSALEVDLSGQVNSEVLNGRHVGVIGGQSDFMRGTLRSPGGRNIIVMDATADAAAFRELPGNCRMAS